MSSRARLGLYAGGAVLLAVLLFAGLVWRVEDVTVDDVTVEVECPEENNGKSIALKFACQGREKPRAE